MKKNKISSQEIRLLDILYQHPGFTAKEVCAHRGRVNPVQTNNIRAILLSLSRRGYVNRSVTENGVEHFLTYKGITAVQEERELKGLKTDENKPKWWRK